MIIGIGYKADTGKDTVAEHLVRAHDFVRFAYGDVLRDLCARVFTWTHHEMTDRVEKEEWDDRWGMTRRQGLQRMGDAVRREFGDDVLVRNAMLLFLAAKNSGQNIVVSDVRKRVECDAIKSAGGQLWLMNRPGAHAVSAHATESELDGYHGWDVTVDNTGTIDELLVSVDWLIARNKKKESK